MTIIQAHRRTKTYTHRFIGEAPLVFNPNELGDVVCDVQSEHHAERLLASPEAFRAYAAPGQVPAQVVILPVTNDAAALSPVLTQAPTAPEGGNSSTEQPAEEAPAAEEHVVEDEPSERAEPEKAPDPYLLKAGDTEYDLRPLTDAALREFAQANGIQVGKKLRGDAIRDAIVAALKQ